MNNSKFIKIIIQILILCILYIIFQKIIYILNIPIPASVLGMVIISTLLITNIIPLHWIEDGAQVLIKIMPIMFVPDGVALVYSGAMLKDNGLTLLFLLLISTLLVMSITALTSIAMQKNNSKSIEVKKVEG
ncbi:hypothetical protein BTR23_09580 [Alkalihalophilus pseudofirmus]|nr:hypothetical protein BTR23_09580 [Alkalihalophilus pseudofirmus]